MHMPPNPFSANAKKIRMERSAGDGADETPTGDKCCMMMLRT